MRYEDSPEYKATFHYKAKVANEKARAVVEAIINEVKKIFQ